MQLDQRQLSHLLDVWPVARLASVGVQGQPHLVPIVFVALDGAIYSPIDGKPKSNGTLQRIRNVAADARVSLLLDRYDDDWDRLWWVRIEANASVVRNPNRPRFSRSSPRCAANILSTRRSTCSCRCADAVAFAADAAHRVVVSTGRMGVAVTRVLAAVYPRIRDGVHLWQHPQKRRAAAMVALGELLRDSLTCQRKTKGAPPCRRSIPMQICCSI